MCLTIYIDLDIIYYNSIKLITLISEITKDYSEVFGCQESLPGN